MFLHDVKIGTKLFLAFGFFIVLMVISSTLSLLSLNRTNNGMQEIVHHDYPTTIKANDLIDNFNAFINNQQLMLLDNEGKWTADTPKQLTDISASITALLEELSKSLPDEESQKILGEIRTVRQQYLDSRFRILDAVKRNDRAGAVEEMMTHTVQIQTAYKDKVMDLIAVQNKKMRTAGDQVQDDFSTNRLVMILLAVFSISVGSLLGLYIMRMITRPLSEAVVFAEAIADGDLTRAIDSPHRDETGILLRALMEMKNRLVDIVHEVQHGSESISSAAAQIVAGNQDLAARTEEQASSVEQTAASMEQITATVKNTADHTSEATQLSAGAATVVKNNGEMMKQVTEKMRVINETSNRMSDIINLIDSTRLLSRPIFWRLTRRLKRRGQGSTGGALQSWRAKCVNSRRKARHRPMRSVI